METIKLSASSGLIFKKSSINAQKISVSQIQKTLETYPILDENKDLISFGPIFPEAIDELIKRIEELGLKYVDDFFDLTVDLPEWLLLNGSLNKPE